MPTNKELEQLVKNMQERFAVSEAELVSRQNNMAEAVVGLAKTADDQSDKIDQILVSVSTLAKNVPTSFNKKRIEAAELDHGSVEDRHFVEGFDDAVIEPARMADIENPEFKAKAEYLRFMMEPVTVFIQTTSEKDADQVFDISVNGVSKVFVRGMSRTVPRMYVEGLARARPVHYESVEFLNEKNERAMKYPATRGLRYNFTVERDDNPRGAEWLAKALKAA